MSCLLSSPSQRLVTRWVLPPLPSCTHAQERHRLMEQRSSLPPPPLPLLFHPLGTTSYTLKRKYHYTTGIEILLVLARERNLGKLGTHLINGCLVSLLGAGLLEDGRTGHKHVHTGLSNLPGKGSACGGDRTSVVEWTLLE